MWSRAGIRFLATTVLLVAARALDALTTWIATRDLALESNPLTRVLHLGWWGLLLVNTAVVGVIAVAAWHAAFTPPALPREPGLDFPAFVARYWFARTGRRSVSQAICWLPADVRVRMAFIGGPGAVLVIVGSAVAAAWNTLVARHVVAGPALGRLGLAAFWLGLALGLTLAVRIFLVRAYARYARATPGPNPARAAAWP
jgi:hypothetical protein